MRLDARAVGLALGITFAVPIVFLTGIANLIWPGYGQPLLDILAALYPGYKGLPGLGHVVVASLYAFVDGAVIGLIYAWAYNRFLRGEGER